MPESRTVQQKEKEDQKQQMPSESIFRFHQKIHYKGFFKFLRTVFHTIGSFLSLTKIDNNGIYNYFIIRNLYFIIPIITLPVFV